MNLLATMRALIGGVLVSGALVVGTLAPATTAQALSSKSELLSAKVPSMCRNPAGRLVNGSLRHIPGHVSLDMKHSTLGNLVRGGGTGAVATINCDAGGVSWADHVLFYSASRKVIGHFDTGDLGIGGRTMVKSVSVASRVVTVKVIGVARKTDNEQWGSTGVKITFSYDPASHRMKRRTTKYYTEYATAAKLLSLVRAGKYSSARQIASSSVVKNLSSWARKDKASRNVTLTMGKCVGMAYSWHYGHVVAPSDRACQFTLSTKAWSKSKGRYVTTKVTKLALFGHPSGDKYWTQWRAHTWK